MIYHNKIKELMDICEVYNLKIIAIGHKYFQIMHMEDFAVIDKYYPYGYYKTNYIYEVNKELTQTELSKLISGAEIGMRSLKKFKDIPKEQTRDWLIEQFNNGNKEVVQKWVEKHEQNKSD